MQDHIKYKAFWEMYRPGRGYLDVQGHQSKDNN